MKIITRIPFRAEVEAETKKVLLAVMSANYSGYFSVFVYTNIALYFAFMIKVIYF